jgi:hypothetical protein
MADSVLIDNKKVSSADTITPLYTSPTGGGGTIITAFTASNNSAASASYKAYIFDSSGSSVDAIIPQKIVVRDRFDSGPSIVNQVVPAGGTIRVENSTADSISYYATGREQ